jgi:hypothetical protein
MTNLSTFKLVTKADAAAIFGVCTKSIDNYIKQGLLPPPVQFMSKEYWHPEEFKAILDQIFKRPTGRDMTDAETEKSGTIKSAIAANSSQKGSARLRDSSAAVRQEARQSEKLKMLNG